MKILIIGLDIVPAVDLFGDERLENLRHLMAYGCYGKLSGFGLTSKPLAWISLLTGQYADAAVLSGIQDLNPELWPAAVQDMILWREVERQGKQVIVHRERQSSDHLDIHTLDAIYTASQARFENVRHKLSVENWDYFQFVDDGLEQLFKMLTACTIDPSVLDDYRLHLDKQLGLIFELLSEETAVLVISPASLPFQPDREGGFILAASNNPLSGEIDGVGVDEIAPTMLELAGYEIPTSMISKSLAAGKAMNLLSSGALSVEEEAILRERLSGLGYIG